MKNKALVLFVVATLAIWGFLGFQAYRSHNPVLDSYYVVFRYDEGGVETLATCVLSTKSSWDSAYRVVDKIETDIKLDWCQSDCPVLILTMIKIADGVAEKDIYF